MTSSILKSSLLIEMPMKKVLISLSLFCCLNLYADGFSFKNSGKFTSSSGTLRSPIENTETGTMTISNTTFSNLVLNKGTIDCKNSQFFRRILNEGTLLAKDTTFHDLLIISKGTTTLASCKLADIEIFAEDTAPVIHLNEDTVVSGSIVFIRGLGKVFASPSVTIQGEVRGGELIVKEPDQR